MGVATPVWLVLITLAAALINVVAAWMNLRAARKRAAADDSLRLQVSDLGLKLRLAELELERTRERAAIEGRLDALEDQGRPTPSTPCYVRPVPVTRELLPPPCPKCKGVQLIRPEQANEPPPPSEWDEMGYVKCDVCGGAGAIWPADIDQSKL
jgi:hypothetical protein